MFTWMWIFEIVLCAVQADPTRALAATLNNITSCEEFELGARFDPLKVIDSRWKIFYFWADTTELYPIIFSLPTTKRLERFKASIDVVAPELGVEWHRAAFMMEPRPGVQILLMDAGTPGAYRALVKNEHRDKMRPYPAPLIKFADVRMKLVGRYIGMMCCELLTAYALARIDEIPATEADCKAAAETIGYRGPDGRSYLYVTKLRNSEL